MAAERSIGRRGFPVGLTVTVAVCLAILCGLGAWQVKRLHWKEGVLAQIAARQHEAPLSLDAALARPDPEFSRVAVDCPGLAGAPFASLYALKDGQAGVRLISLCPQGGRNLLVDRGFVADTVSARPPVAASAAPVHVVGALRRSHAAGPFTPRGGRMQFAPDTAVLGAALGVRGAALPVFLSAETSSNPDWPALQPAPLPTDIPNNHLQYALTWFGLAAVLACIYAAMLWRRMRG